MVSVVRRVQRVRGIQGVRGALELSLVIVLVAGSAHPAVAQAPSARKAAEAAILKADREFNRSTADRDLNRFLSFVAQEATFNTNRGREAIGKAWAPFFAPDGPTITWAPTKAEALVGDDVGYSVGTWERHTKGPDGAVKVTHGQYLTVWEKQKDGTWQATFDTGSTAP
jgi:ketosteroid isomerase-like protein